MAKKVNVVLFDFDGTLSWPDSNLAFAMYCMRHSWRPWLFMPLFGVGMIARFVCPKSVCWRQNVRRFINPAILRRHLPAFTGQHRQNRFGWATDQIAAERAAGNIVLLVSASPDYLIEPLVKDMGFDAVFCSKMDVKHPWKYKFFCWGDNKVVAVNKWAKENGYDPHVVRAYSDSKSDIPMMKMADEQIWINPKTQMPR